MDRAQNSTFRAKIEGFCPAKMRHGRIFLTLGVIAKRNFRNGGRRPAGRRGKPAGLPHHFGNYFWQPVYHHCTAALPPHEPRGTSNIEPPTPNIEWQRESSLTSAFGVRGWTFDAFPRFRGSISEIFRGNLSPRERVRVRRKVGSAAADCRLSKGLLSSRGSSDRTAWKFRWEA